jgi:hypothetical protein
VKTSQTGSFTLTLSPSANSSITGPGDLQAASASVYYTVRIYIPKITLSGVISPTDKRMLIGQKLVASVDLDGLPHTAPPTYS